METAIRGLPLLSGPAPIVEEPNRHGCRKCGKEFGLFTRSRACNHCGFTYCYSCSDHTALMAREGGEQPGYDTVHVCAFCIEKLTITASGRTQLRSQTVATLKAYLKAYGLSSPANVLEKEEIVDAVIAARISNGCLPPANEDYYRKHSVPNRTPDRRSRSLFQRMNDAFPSASPAPSNTPNPNPIPNTRPTRPAQSQNRPSAQQQPPRRPASNPSGAGAGAGRGRGGPVPSPGQGQSQSQYNIPSNSPYGYRPPGPQEQQQQQQQQQQQRPTNPNAVPRSPQPRNAAAQPPPTGGQSQNQNLGPGMGAGQTRPGATPSPAPTPSVDELLGMSSEELHHLSVGVLKDILYRNHVLASQILEKDDLVAKVVTLIEAERRDRAREAEIHEREERAYLEQQRILREGFAREMAAREEREQERNSGSGEEHRHEHDHDHDSEREHEYEHGDGVSVHSGHSQSHSHDGSTHNPTPDSMSSDPSTPDHHHDDHDHDHGHVPPPPKPFTEHAHPPTAAPPPAPATVERSGLCVICQDEEACIVIVDCGHLAMCRSCSDLVMNTSRECPLCRTRIVTPQRLLRVYRT